MNQLHNKRWLLIMGIIVIFGYSCKKQDDFLNAKPDAALAVISTLHDCEMLLNDTYNFNILDPYLPAQASEEFFIIPSRLVNQSAQTLANYTWAKDVYAGSNEVGNGSSSWSSPYNQIFYANSILDALPGIKISASQQVEYNNVKGMALFYRAWQFYNLVQAYALPYNAQTAVSLPGIPLRLSANLNDKIVRSSIQQCYDQVIGDVSQAILLLPETVLYPTQPNKTAAHAFLARIYLGMSDYVKAGNYADTTLRLFNRQLDLNSIDCSKTPLFSGYSPDEIYHSAYRGALLLGYSSSTAPDSLFYQSYRSNDLRLKAYFNFNTGTGYYRIKAAMDYRGICNFGLVTDEIYLIRAECYARAGETQKAMDDLNALLINKYITGTFVSYTAANADDALVQILAERRKELMFRGLRWSDLRRLNQEDRFKTTLTRSINGVSYTLPPNDPRYALPIPYSETSISGIPQNPR